MTNGKHCVPKNRPKRNRPLLPILAVALLLVLTSGVTLAFLTVETGDIQNAFSPSHVRCEVTGNAAKGYTVKNTGDTAAYIRAAVVANTLDDNGNVTGTAAVTVTASDWVKNGEYWIWPRPVQPDASTPAITVSGAADQVSVLAEAIQSEPVSAVSQAWGWSPAA